MMNDRARAVAILRQAREILLARLTERVLDLEEELLSDAQGLSFSSEIETLYEQVSLRLNHVNSMLSHLPPEEEPVRPALPYHGGEVPLAPLMDLSVGEGRLIHAQTAAPAMHGLESVLHEQTVLPTLVTFELFARQVLCDDLESAGRSLSVLFAVEEELGRQAATAFSNRLSQTPDAMTRLLQLRRELLEGGTHGPLKLLEECFGLRGLKSLTILQTLRARLMGHNEAA